MSHLSVSFPSPTPSGFAPPHPPRPDLPLTDGGVGPRLSPFSSRTRSSRLQDTVWGTGGPGLPFVGGKWVRSDPPAVFGGEGSTEGLPPRPVWRVGESLKATGDYRLQGLDCYRTRTLPRTRGTGDLLLEGKRLWDPTSVLCRRYVPTVSGLHDSRTPSGPTDVGARRCRGVRSATPGRGSTGTLTRRRCLVREGSSLSDRLCPWVESLPTCVHPRPKSV